MQEIAHVAAVAVAGPTALCDVVRQNASAVDLAGWIARSSERIALLKDPAVFDRAGLGLYGESVTWNGDEGDLAIDSEHLRMIADHQAPLAAADVAVWQAEMGVLNAEAADLVGVVPSTWSSYMAGANVAATIALLCRAMRADPVILSGISGQLPARPICRRTLGFAWRGDLGVAELCDACIADCVDSLYR